MDCISLSIQIDKSIQKQLLQVSQDRKREGESGHGESLHFSTHNKLAKKQVTCAVAQRRAIPGWLQVFHADHIFTPEVSVSQCSVCHSASCAVPVCFGK